MLVRSVRWIDTTRSLAPLYFCATVALLRLAASVWDGWHLNRLITVGSPAVTARVRGSSTRSSTSGSNVIAPN